MDLIFFLFLLLVPFPFFYLALRDTKVGTENYKVLFFGISAFCFLLAGMITIGSEDVTYTISHVGDSINGTDTYTHYVISSERLRYLCSRYSI